MDIAGELYNLGDYINMLADDFDNSNIIADDACGTVLSIDNIIYRLRDVQTELRKHYD